MKLKITILNEANSASGSKKQVLVNFRLDFDNRAYVSYYAQTLPLDQFLFFQMERKKQKDVDNRRLAKLAPFSVDLFITLFPFALLIDKNLQVIAVGENYSTIWNPNELCINKRVTKYFRLRRPKGIFLTWRNVS